jgi:predicted dehydrogenase
MQKRRLRIQMSRTYKVAVIGAGDMGNRHVNGWKLAGHEVVSITDINRESAEKLADRYQVTNIFTDYKEAIRQRDVEIVSICLPLPLHAPVTIYAAEHGKHVFCEKPLAGSKEEAIQMEEAIRKAGVRFGIGFQVYYAEGVQLLAKYAQEGKFGYPMFAHADEIAEVRPKPIMHDARGNQGPIMDVCCHTFMNWQTIFNSKPKSVYARGAVLAKNRPEIAHIEELAIDTAVITVEYESGDIGSMTVSWGAAAKTKMRGRPFRIFGPKGGAEGRLAASLSVYEGETMEEMKFEPADLHMVQFTRFADCIERGEEAPVGIKQAKEILALTLAVFKSIETNQPVPASCDF